MVIIVLFTMLTWGYQMYDGQQLPADFKPWIWWAVGPVAVAAAGAWKNIWAYISLIVAPVLWLVVETSPEGGGTPLGLAIQDSLYTFFFSTALVVMTLALRDRASDVDRENSKAIEAVLERTRTEVLNRERAIFNSIIHDKVLTTLELAANATSDKARKAAAAAAEDAIGRLNREVDRTANPPEKVSVGSIAEPLVEAINRRSPEFKVSLTGTNGVEIPFQVAAAIFEATLLAVSNSMTHAPRASERKVLIRLSQRGIKVVISDNGSGFRMSNVHKTALGVRWTIFRRLESLGVKPSLDSKPGTGTTWIFEWYA
jgi:signal transduction histidine kinase